jgi:hypothetical protein
MSENGQKFVFVYANRLNPVRDAFSEIVDAYGGKDNVRREYVVDAAGVGRDDMFYDHVRLRLGRIVETLADGERVKIVLAGYSPLVAVLHDIAQEMGLEEAYFIRDSTTHKFVEERLVRSSA